jgi:hypothetical protein
MEDRYGVSGMTARVAKPTMQLSTSDYHFHYKQVDVFSLLDMQLDGTLDLTLI